LPFHSVMTARNAGPTTDASERMIAVPLLAPTIAYRFSLRNIIAFFVVIMASIAATATAATTKAASTRYPALFICHGGGPMPLLDDPSMRSAVKNWKQHVRDFYSGSNKPTAIVVVSAHYETSREVHVGGAATPKMIYDYGGFPPETYKLQYPAPGKPELSERIVQLLKKAGIAAKLDASRGFDHGVFVPLMLMWPDADIPVIPMSVLRSQGAAEHIAIGRAISELRDENILILGSGSSSHNFHARGPRAGSAFNDHLSRVITDAGTTAQERERLLEEYLSFPGAEEAQQAGAAEHLVPLFTVLGTAAGNQQGVEIANIEMASWNERHYLFEQ
jgi:aromatic ring-opening dioxygenase catalytic subunit (LigB family)